jgi:hypothetical protein
MRGSLGRTLATASGSGAPGMEQWKREVIAAGDERQGQGTSREPYGFHVMSDLMQEGEWDSDFLGDYGKEVLTFERKGIEDGSSPEAVWGNPSWGDPVTGLLEGVSHNPDAATDLFNDKTLFKDTSAYVDQGFSMPWSDDDTKSYSTAEYLLHHREYFDTDDNGKVTTEIAHDGAAYGTLEKHLNEVAVQDIKTEDQHPARSLDRAGRVNGFLEYAANSALSDDAEEKIDKSDWSTSVIGSVTSTGLGYVPVAGDALSGTSDLIGEKIAKDYEEDVEESVKQLRQDSKRRGRPRQNEKSKHDRNAHGIRHVALSVRLEPAGGPPFYLRRPSLCLSGHPAPPRGR